MFNVIKNSLNKIIPRFFNDELGKFKKDKMKKYLYFNFVGAKH